MRKKEQSCDDSLYLANLNYSYCYDTYIDGFKKLKNKTTQKKNYRITKSLFTGKKVRGKILKQRT
jgi:hypothetical protein